MWGFNSKVDFKVESQVYYYGLVKKNKKGTLLEQEKPSKIDDFQSLALQPTLF